MGVGASTLLCPVFLFKSCQSWSGWMGGTQLRIIVPSVSLLLSQETQGGLLIQSIIIILIILIKTIFVVVIVFIDIAFVMTTIISLPAIVPRGP